MPRSTIYQISLVILLSASFTSLSCKRGPDTQEPYSLEIKTEIVDSFEDIRWSEHGVIVREVLPSSKYLYLKVEEGNKTYWIATGPGSVKPGNRYFFNEAVVKQDFRSPDLDREFDSIYLVAQFLPESRKNELKRMRFNPHASKSDEEDENSDKAANTNEEVQIVSLDELLNYPKRYENLMIEVEGICSKINEGILKRNWIHLKTDPDAEKEIVATSSSTIKVGESLTLRAIVRINKDFGAGYVYPILLEDAVIIE